MSTIGNKLAHYVAAGVIGLSTPIASNSIHQNSSVSSSEVDASRQKYYETLHTLKQLGLDINAELSKYYDHSKSLLIFLPDVHNDKIFSDQSKRIHQLDSALSLDVICLEGLRANERPAITAEHAKMVDKILDTLLIPQKDVHYNYTISISDPKIVIIQKAFANLTSLLGNNQALFSDTTDFGIAGSAEMKKVYERSLSGSERSKQLIESMKEFMVELNENFAINIPNKKLPYVYGQPFCDYELYKEFLLANKRIFPPSINYTGLKTRAPKLGMENSAYDQMALKNFFAWSEGMDYERLTQALQLLDTKYTQFIKNTTDVATPSMQAQLQQLKKAMFQFSSFMQDYLEEIKSEADDLHKDCEKFRRNSFLNENKVFLSPLSRDKNYRNSIYLPDDTLNFFNAARTYSWCDFAQKFKMPLVIGGGLHAELFYKYAEQANTSIITIQINTDQYLKK